MNAAGSLNRRYLKLPLWLRLPIAFLGVSIFFVVTQDTQIFPGALGSLFKSNQREVSTLPEGVIGRFVETLDGERLEVWKLPVVGSKSAAVIFHGNAGDVENFFPYQKFFQQLGITSYGFDYRGFGKSSGWPSEEGLEADAHAVLRHVTEVERVPADSLILVGVSIGTGPASFAARVYKPKTLLLISPFISLPEAVATVPLFGLLHPFIRHEFPVAENVRSLKGTCVIVAHGQKDSVIPSAQGRAVADAAPPGTATFLLVQGASHNDVLNHAAQRIAQVLASCVD